MLSASSRRLAGSVRRQVIQRVESTIKPSNIHQQSTRRFSTVEQGGQGGQGGAEGESTTGGSGGLWKSLAVIGGSALVGGYIYAYYVWPETHPGEPFPIPLPTNPLDSVFKPTTLSSSPVVSVVKKTDEPKVEARAAHKDEAPQPQVVEESAPVQAKEVQEEVIQTPNIEVVATPLSQEQEELTERVAEVVDETLRAISEPAVQAEIQEVANTIQETFNLGETVPLYETDAISESTEQFSEDANNFSETPVTKSAEDLVGEEQKEVVQDQSETLSPSAQAVISCEERLAVIRQHYENMLLQLDQRANYLHQQVNDEKERHLELKEAFITMRDLYEEKLRKLEEESQDRTNRLLFEARTEMLREVDKTIKETDLLCELRNAKLHESRLKQIAEVHHKVLELKNAALSQGNLEKAEHKREQIILGLSNVILALQQNKPTLNKELQQLFELVKNRPDLQKPLSHIPKAFISGQEPVQSREHLKSRFDTVLKVARTQSLVPEDGGLFWQLWASTVSTVISPILPSTSSEDKSADGILSRALHFVKTDDFVSAVKELRNLKGNASDVVQSWVEDVQDRLLLENSLWCAIGQLNSLVAPSSSHSPHATATSSSSSSSSSCSSTTTPSSTAPKCH